VTRQHLHLPSSLGERAADALASRVGSWLFLGLQSLAILTWAALNLTGILRLDPWPLIFLNLCLSLQAAFTGPVLQMASNRRAAIDQRRDNQEALEVSAMFERLEHLVNLNEHDQMDKLDLIARKIDAHHRLTKHEEKPQ
jgi:uncharacterized membrane protein